LGKRAFSFFPRQKDTKRRSPGRGQSELPGGIPHIQGYLQDETVDQSEEFEFDITTSENKFFHTMLTGGWAKSFTFPRKPKFGRHNYYWVTRLPQWSRDVSKSREITWSGSRNFTRVGSRDLKF
jgi:hypothetical protein